jgi:hypothetical protein
MVRNSSTSSALAAQRAFLVRDALAAEPGVPERFARLTGGHHHQVLAAGHGMEFMRDLEGAQKALGKQDMGRQAGDVLAIHHDAARGGGQDACDDVEQRGLARAIGADQGGDRARLDRQACAVDGVETAEMLVQVVER